MVENIYTPDCCAVWTMVRGFIIIIFKHTCYLLHTVNMNFTLFHYNIKVFSKNCSLGFYAAVPSSFFKPSVCLKYYHTFICQFSFCFFSSFSIFSKSITFCHKLLCSMWFFFTILLLLVFVRQLPVVGCDVKEPTNNSFPKGRKIVADFLIKYLCKSNNLINMKNLNVCLFIYLSYCSYFLITL